MSTPNVYTLQKSPTFKEYGRCSVEVPDTKRDGQTGHYRNPKWSQLKGDLEVGTVADLFESGLAQAKTMNCLGHRPIKSQEPLTFEAEYVWETYEQIDTRRRAVGSALVELFISGRLTAGELETVGLWSINRPEWQIVDIALQSYRKVTVSLYDTLGPNSVEYIINHAETSIVFTSEKNIQALLDLADKCAVLKMVVSFDTLEASAKTKFVETAKEKGIEFLEFSEFEAIGTAKLVDPIQPGQQDVSTICYTSGTTATPKGVVLTHKNLASAVLSNCHSMKVPRHYVMISYLPLAHIYGRLAELAALTNGGSIGYYTGNPVNLLSDCQALKPHFFPGVPRVLNKIYQVAMANTRLPGLKGFLFRQAVASKEARLKASGETRHLFWDPIIFRKVQAALGGRVTFITCGSAPINGDTLNFFKYSFMCDVVEVINKCYSSYGLTETCATCAYTWIDDLGSVGSIGGVQLVNEVKLVDVPELSYSAEDKPNPRGELCIRGDNVFSKYFKDEENTRAAIDAEGWFHTGDIAEIDSNGRLKIIDRLKNIMKLAQGEYVALEKIENLYTACPVVAQVYIHGDSLQDHLLAVIVPEPVALSIIAAEAGYKFDPKAEPAVEAACKDETVRKAVLDDTIKRMKKVGLKGFEIAKDLHLTTQQFTVENNTMTPTFKIKRKEAYAFHKEVLDGLYAKAKAAAK